MSDLREDIPRIIRTLTGYHHMTLAELGRQIGLSGTRMSEKMHGRSPFTVEQIGAMAEALDVDPGVWFDEPENALLYLRRPEPESQNWKRTDPPAVAALPAVSDDEAAVRVA
jgi:transcriptional regulator with XRE-family HTH domain